MSKITPEDLEALIELFDASDWEQLDLEVGGCRLHLSKRPEPTRSAARAAAGHDQPLFPLEPMHGPY